jgi:cysteine desulfurase/selenocysteine lyase
MSPARAVVPSVRTGSGFDPESARADFPALHQLGHGRPLAYLDNAATTHKPQAVIDAVSNFYSRDNSNVHRGLHELSERATRAYEGARGRIARFLNAPDARQIVFVKGTTDAVNLVASSFGRLRVGAGDDVLISGMEHHSNIVPWQMLCESVGAHLRVAPVSDAGELRVEDFEKLIGPRTRLVSIVHVSNSLGTINPVREIVSIARARKVPVLVDGAQAVAHLEVDVQELDCDFYAFSGHKIYGPTGIGALWARPEFLEEMPPVQGGGDMISSVTFEKTTWNRVPFKFEAGTPEIAGAVGLAAALDYLDRLGRPAAAAWEAGLLEEATRRIGAIPGARIIGTARAKSSVLSFVLEGIHPHDIGTILDQQGVAIRAGHHCTQPLMARFGVPATARASFAFYNTPGEIDALVEGIGRVQSVLG